MVLRQVPLVGLLCDLRLEPSFSGPDFPLCGMTWIGAQTLCPLETQHSGWL